MPFSATDLVRRDFDDLYEINKTALGVGSNGEVFLATLREANPSQTSTRIGKIAVKVLIKNEDQGDVMDLPVKLQREVELMAMAQGHPSVAKFHGLFMADHPLHPSRSWFIAMEYYPGGDLLDRVAKRCLSEGSCKALIKAMLGALDHLHGLGIVHRDVKAENILLNSQGLPILSDLGISCLVSDKTEMKRRCGSPGYMAPEMLTSEYGHEVDLFALGVVLFFALSGKLPFSGPNLPAVLRRTMSAAVDFDSPCFEKVSSSCRSMILGLLDKQPENRMTIREACGHSWLNVLTAKLVPGDSSRGPSSVSTSSPSSTTCGTPVGTNQAFVPVAPPTPSVLARFKNQARKVVPGTIQKLFKQTAATDSKEACDE